MRAKRKSGAAAEEVILSSPPDEDINCSGIRVSLFDYCVENYFRAMDTVGRLCGESESDLTQDSEVTRLSSSVTFLREWRHFNYKPKVVRFAYEADSAQESDVFSNINLPQFSSAAVPKREQYGGTTPLESSKDFVLCTGGPVWALDWCPRVRLRSDNHVKCEFIAVSAHPPDSSYHKMGAPLIGRGIVQIWCVLNVSVNEDEVPLAPERPKKSRGRPRKQTCGSTDDVYSDKQLAVLQPMSDSLNISVNVTEKLSPLSKELMKKKLNEQKEPRGRPRKKQINEYVDDIGSNNQLVVLQPLSESSDVCTNKPEVPPTESPQGHMSKKVMNYKFMEPRKPRGRPREKQVNESVDDMIFNNELEELQPTSGSSDVCINEAEVPPPTGNPEQGFVSKEVTKNELMEPNKPDILSKKPVNESVDNVDSNDQFDQVTAIQIQADHSELLAIEDTGNENEGVVSVNHDIKLKGQSKIESASNSTLKTYVRKKFRSTAKAQIHANGLLLPLLTQSEGIESPVMNLKEENANEEEDPAACTILSNKSSEDISLASSCIPKDAALPKLVLCLAHNGKVAWDVKWRPSNVYDSECKYRMGYLAVLLGNGCLEVWEVPLPRTIKAFYSSSQWEGTDPRFVKLKPVFRCSKLRSGGMQSIPLSVEWSTLPPHDVLLAGCHDGTVALWKFSTTGVCEDARPFLHFSADTVPIRAVAWAPAESDPESANIIATGGHGGLKFWDIRDPYRPLWDFHPVPKVIYSMDWLKDPRCVILSFDDGALRFLSLVTSAYDGPVTGDSSSGTKHPGLHTYNDSSFAIWSVQVSRLTGMVAYCSEDGTVACFQLTTKAVEKGSSRYRATRFLCGSVTEEESALIINTPMLYTPLQLKTSLNESGDSKAKEQTSGNQNLALCCRGDPSTTARYEETTAASKSKKTSKSKSKRRPEDDEALVCRGDEEPANEEDGPREASGKDFDAFPHKAVAMHRVRWNTNEGSERWLCFGGAAGVVRCREIAIANAAAKKANWKP